jgi:hypothetical protein
MLLRDAGAFADPNARRGGFRASAVGIENMAGLSEQDKENILGGHLTRVLGLTWSVCTTSGLAGTTDVTQRWSP